LSKFGCHGNSVGSLEILDSIFEVANPDYLTIYAKNSSICFLQRTEISAIVAYFANIWLRRQLPGFIEIVYSIFKFIGPKNLTIYAINCFGFLLRTEISAILAYFCLYLVAVGNSLGSLKNSGSIFEFTNCIPY